MAPGICDPSPSRDSCAVKGVAGMYDWHQDGKGQDPVAVEAGKSVAALLPNYLAWTHENRAMVNRAVRLLARNGVSQVVDLGSGKPSPHGKSTHEAVLRVTPEARVLRVEREIGMIQGDALETAAIMGNEEAKRVIDWNKPVVLVMSALVHFFRPEQYRPMMDFWRTHLTKDSALVMTHGSFDEYNREILNNVLAHYERMGMKAYLRSKEDLVDVMEGWTLMAPGIVRAGHWNAAAREEEEDIPSNFEFWWVAVGSLMRKRH